MRVQMKPDTKADQIEIKNLKRELRRKEKALAETAIMGVFNSKYLSVSLMAIVAW